MCISFFLGRYNFPNFQINIYIFHSPATWNLWTKAHLAGRADDCAATTQQRKTEPATCMLPSASALYLPASISLGWRRMIVTSLMAEHRGLQHQVSSKHETDAHLHMYWQQAVFVDSMCFCWTPLNNHSPAIYRYAFPFCIATLQQAIYELSVRIAACCEIMLFLQPSPVVSSIQHLQFLFSPYVLKDLILYRYVR